MSKLRSLKKRLGAAYRAFNNVPAAPAKAAAKAAPPQEQTRNIVADDSKVTIEALNPDYCVGCGACANVCPKGAISMVENDEGFLSPVVDHEKCISCKLCKNICPPINQTANKGNSQQSGCYAVWAEDELRMKSSSGGMFTILAEHILDKGGYVCGAEYDKENSFYVRHRVISDKAELESLRGSKYVQSDTGYTFREIKELLDKDSDVLFCGTPCQVAGLKNFLRKDYEKLLTCDLVCHGVPAYKAFNEYISEKYAGKEIADFRFRQKELSYECTKGIVDLKDGSREVITTSHDPYEKLFHGSLMFRNCCYDCQYAELPRYGDFTLGDFWGISQFDPELNDGKGTTLMLVNDQKAEKILEEVKDRLKLIKEAPLDIAKRNNSFGSRRPKPAARKRFYAMLKKGYPFAKAAHYTIKNKYDIGVIGLWFGENYGSILTYYGLNNVLENELGLSVLMINNPLTNAKGFPNSPPEKFGAKYYNISSVLPVKDLGQLNSRCDAFLVGSDQLWNYWLSKRYGQTYFLDFADDSKKKIAYGTSFGADNYNGPLREKYVSMENLKRFDAVSVREDSGVTICRDEFGIEAVKVCDPVFLSDTKVFEELADRNEIDFGKGEYIFAYILDPSPEKRDVLRAAVKKWGKKVVVFLDEPMKIFEENKQRFELDASDGDILVYETVTADKWLKYLKDSCFVITDSFHGCCFASLFKRSFAVMKNNKRGGGRFYSVLSMFALEDRIAEEPARIIEDQEHFFGEVDYSKFDGYLNDIRTFSLEWLKKALFSPKVISNYSAYPVIDKRLTDECK